VAIQHFARALEGLNSVPSPRDQPAQCFRRATPSQELLMLGIEIAESTDDPDE
jgi:hypothetical protein